MAIQISINLIPFQTAPPRWGDLSPSVQPRTDVVVFPFLTGTPRWGDLLEVPTSDFNVIPFVTGTPRWGDLVDATPPEIITSPDQSSVPYIQESGLCPPNGSTDVPITETISIPCGDRVPEVGDALIDPLFATSSPTVTIGLDSSKTVISFGTNGGTKSVIYSNNTPDPAWSVTKLANDYSGNERDVLAGWTYSVQPVMGFSFGILAQFEIYVEDYAGNGTTYNYSFSTLASPTQYMSIESVFTVAQDVLKITFSSPAVVTRSFRSPSSYQILDLNGNVVASVVEILPVYEDSKVTTQLWVKVTGLVPGLRYVFSVRDEVLFDATGHPYAAMTYSWLMNKTKVDLVLSSFSGMYSTKERGTLRGILEAIMLSDEEIGGDF